MSNFKN